MFSLELFSYREEGWSSCPNELSYTSVKLPLHAFHGVHNWAVYEEKSSDDESSNELLTSHEVLEQRYLDLVI